MVVDILKLLRRLAFGRLTTKKGDVPDDAQEWGPGIEWRTLQAGEVTSSLEKKPLMLIVYFPGCPVCGSLKRSMYNSQEVAQISPYFVMSLTNELDVPQTRKYYPDNIGYVPRVLFFDHRGKPMPQYINEMGNPNRKYFYPNARSVIKTMQKVADEYNYDPGITES